MSYTCNACGRYVESGSCGCYTPSDSRTVSQAYIDALVARAQAAEARVETLTQEHAQLREQRDDAIAVWNTRVESNDNAVFVEDDENVE